MEAERLPLRPVLLFPAGKGGGAARGAALGVPPHFFGSIADDGRGGRRADICHSRADDVEVKAAPLSSLLFSLLFLFHGC